MTRIAAIIGGGVIGGGWAARFLLNGWDVQVHDPDPEAARKIAEVLANARRSLPALGETVLPEEGRLSFHDSVAGAVAGAAWVQESVPERLDLKHAVYETIQASCDAGAVIGSSTSGFKPSDLQAGAARPGQIIVTHPFNPVYLLPLVEVVPSADNAPEMISGAKTILEELGMFPLLVRKEIEGHVADRLLEAVWRESLWLVKDGIATTEEIDEAIRMGFGLRWAQMGLFDTYRIAGGEAGMRHFMAQFGPCLSLPWTKLMEVPEFTDDLVELIAGQSDAQSGQFDIREMERIRDDNLVAMLRALKARKWGAGAVLAERDARLVQRAGMARRIEEVADLGQPILTQRRIVPVDWLDYNGHMNESRYLQAVSDATDRFMEIIGCDAAYIAAGGSFFTAETHIRHLGEVHRGDLVEVHTRVLRAEGKKMHLWTEISVGGQVVATAEQMLLHVSLETRRPAPFGPVIAENLARIAAAQGDLPDPEGRGRFIGAPR